MARLRARGELRVEGPGLRGLRRLERPDVGDLLAALFTLPEVAGRGEAIALPAPFRSAGWLGSRTLRIQTPSGMVVAKQLGSSPGLRRTGPRGFGPELGLLGPSGAARAHLAAHRLRALGVPTPRVLGYVERSARPASGASWLVTEHVPAPSLAELGEAGLLDDPGARRRAILAAAECVRRLHGAGWVHPGLDVSRLLAVEDAAVLVGLDGLARARSLRARAEDLARLAVGMDPRTIGPLERARFLAAYLGPVPEPRVARAAWVDAVSRALPRVTAARQALRPRAEPV